MLDDLPTPNAQEVEEFKRLYAERFSLDLSGEEALMVATHYLHMFVILTEEP